MIFSIWRSDFVSFKEGDFLKVEYSAWRSSDKSLVFTTSKKVAQEAKLYNESDKYEPVLVIVGKNTIVSGVDKALATMNVDESRKVEVGPEDGFGERNDDLVRVMQVSDFRKKDIEPRPGLQIDIDGALAVVKSVNSGRVVVDANHPLAGERLTYEVTVVAKLDNDSEKVKALALRSGIAVSSAKAEGASAEVSVGEGVEKNADYFINKTAFTNSVFRYMPGMQKVVVVEEYSRKEAEKQGRQAGQ